MRSERTREKVGPKLGVDERRESKTQDIRARPEEISGQDPLIWGG